DRRFYSFPQLIKTNDNYIILASARTPVGIPPGASQVFVLKLSMDLSDTIWSYYNIDSLEFDNVTGLLELSDGSIAVCGVRNYPDDQVNQMDAIVLKLSPTGEMRFFNVYDEGRFDALNRNLAETLNKGILVAGNSNSPNDPNRAYVVKIDSTGNQQWVKYYPQMTSAYISKYDENKYILSGYLISAQKPKLLLIDSAGNVLKNNSLNSPGCAGYVGRKVSNGGIVVVGITTIEGQGDAGYIAKTDSNGTLLWQRIINYDTGTDYFIDFIVTSDHHLLISGAASDGSCCGGQNAWLVKLDSMGCLEPNCWEVGIEDAKENALGIKVFPNPAAEWINFKLPVNSGDITLEMFTISGKRVMNTKLFAPLEAIQVGHLPMGLYLAKLTNSDGTVSTQKIVIAR
ncbi:MAG: T9SS type A sorting domain-containing protein, partial [Bacteroidia bacterium]|nr:T9SS type A sorting domain-containing protein [Bacteroidia bacterium]